MNVLITTTRKHFDDGWYKTKFMWFVPSTGGWLTNMIKYTHKHKHKCRLLQIGEITQIQFHFQRCSNTMHSSAVYNNLHLSLVCQLPYSECGAFATHKWNNMSPPTAGLSNGILYKLHFNMARTKMDVNCRWYVNALTSLTIVNHWVN